MERLSDTAIDIINDLHTERLDYNSEYLPLIDAANKLQEYEDAEEQGLLLKLPCSVGSTVYKICPVSKYLQIGEIWDGKIIETDCQRCAFRVCDCFNIGFMKNALNIIREIKAPDELWILKRKPYFGEIYFITRKEAEQALKGGADK